MFGIGLIGCRWLKRCNFVSGNGLGVEFVKFVEFGFFWVLVKGIRG